jgi:hypothetical protein
MRILILKIDTSDVHYDMKPRYRRITACYCLLVLHVALGVGLYPKTDEYCLRLT